MALIVCIETATKSCSVALSKDGHLVAVKEEVSEQYSHSEQLTVFIEQLLQKERLNVSDLDAIAVSSGPGSYTGLRIGVSTAKGLCYASDVPLIAVSTLSAMAQAMKDKYHETQLCPMLDARRMEVYCALYSKSHASPVVAKIIDQDSFAEELAQGPLLFFGDGADKCQDMLTHTNAHFELGVYPSATNMIPLAQDKFQNQDFEDVAYFEPFYLKDFVSAVKK
ncbi:tRNA (adenosine(37)-N6)-threonylcarbamoyltransferase complex dimerization subunit type 1 TsaB [Flavobacteriales bacterium]|nr:tRNA (adenosine(37)-N6)-threonylcarbamoyltransferase complex dimerization subunit type 1 TsaB [Flavobacteriales bacterium]